MKNTRKLISALLCAMVLLVVPNSVYAEEISNAETDMETSVEEVMISEVTTEENKETEEISNTEVKEETNVSEEEKETTEEVSSTEVKEETNVSEEEKETTEEVSSTEENAIENLNNTSVFRNAIAPTTVAATNNSYASLVLKSQDGQNEETKQYENETDTIGYPTGWGDSNWHIRTYRKIFLGWTTEANYTGASNEKIYSYGEPVKTLVENGDVNKPLYPVFAGMTDALALESELTGTIELNANKNASSTLPGSDLENDEFKVEPGKKIAIVNYDESKDTYEVSLDTNFRFSNNKVAAIVAANPLGLLKPAEGISDFSGENPKEYTFVDLHVVLDERVDVGDVFSNIKFSSGLFMARAVLDESYNVLSTVTNLPTNGEKTQTFSFNNPNKLKKFIIRTTLRNYGQDGGSDQTYRTNNLSSEYTFNDMILTSGDSNNIVVNKELANDIKDKGGRLVFDGFIKGSVAVNKAIIPFPLNLFAPSNMDIAKINSSNTVDIEYITPNKSTPTPTPIVEPKEIEVKWTCADEGKVWNETKQVCEFKHTSRGYKVPNTSSESGIILYAFSSLISLVGLLTLNKRK